MLSPSVVAQDANTESQGASSESQGAASESQGTPVERPALTEPAPLLMPVPQVTTNTYPISEIDRPLAMPRLMIRPEADLGLNFFNNLKGNNKTLDNLVGIDLAVSFSPADHFEIGLGIFDTPMYEENIQRFPISLSPSVHAGRMPIYGLYEFGPFFEDRLRVAARVTFNAHFDNDDYDGRFGNFGMLVDGLAKFKIHDVFAVVAGTGMGFQVGNNFGAFLYNFDMGVLVQPIEPLGFRLTTGFHVKAREDTGGTLIPLLLRIQYTLIGDLDLFVDTGFPDLNDAKANWYSLIIGAAYRVQL
jgi:hypothetical protein